MRKSLKPWFVTTWVASVCLAGTVAQPQCKAGEDKPDKPAAAAAAPATVPAATAAVTPNSPELAARIASLAQDTLQQKSVLPPHFKQAAGFIMAAMRLDPKEPRYPRMLYEAMLQTRDNDGALKALRAYRDLVPGDQLAMVNFIDLKVNTLETADARLDYLNGLAEANVADEVRSHAAFRASQVARERGQADLEDSLLAKSLKLNPLNLDALRARLDALSVDGTPVERVGVLVAMLKSNPVQPGATYRMARELADAGLVEESLPYYRLSVNLAAATGVQMEREFAMGYASELYMTRQPQMLAITEAILDQLVKADSGDVEVLLLRWLAERGQGKKEAAAKTQQQVVNAALNRVLTLRQQLGVTTATTRPVETPDPAVIPDLAEDLAKLKDEKFEAVRVPYAQAATDLAWYLVSVANQPAEAVKLLPTLKAILSDKDPLVVRIEGWAFLAQNQLDQAGVKLKAVADQDVLAQAATYLLWAKNPAEKAPAVAAATKLLQEHPSGLLGALLLDTLKELDVKPTPGPDATAIAAKAKEFPEALLNIINAPKDFYLLRAEMLGSANPKGGSNGIKFPFGEPMYAKVVLKNISTFDITIGPNGIIRNDLWFDAEFRGLLQQTITGAAYERLSGVLVLKPGQTVSQTVRMDQGQLAHMLTGVPLPSLTFTGQVRTNPRGDGGSGPGGYGVPFASITERAGFPIADRNAIGALVNLVATGSPAEKFRSLDFCATAVELLRAETDPAKQEQAKPLIALFLDTAQKAAADPDPAVATWGTFLTAARNRDKLPPIVEKLLADPDPTRRILGTMMVGALPPDQQKQKLTKLRETDKDEMIQAYVTGMIEVAELAAAKPPGAPDAPSAPLGGEPPKAQP